MQVTSPQVIPGDPLIFTTPGGCPCKQPYAKNFGMLFEFVTLKGVIIHDLLRI